MSISDKQPQSPKQGKYRKYGKSKKAVHKSAKPVYKSTKPVHKSTKPVYKSASILPYYFNGKEYLYLLTHEKDDDWCGAFGGGMEKSDRNNPWINACRELGEELYDYQGEKLEKFINRIKNPAKNKRIAFPSPLQKHYSYLCNWKKISPRTSPVMIKQQFRPNVEIKNIHWVKASDLWSQIGKIGNKKLYGKQAYPVYLKTMPLKNYPSQKIRIRPCFVDGLRQMYKKNIHLVHLTSQPSSQPSMRPIITKKPDTKKPDS